MRSRVYNATSYEVQEQFMSGVRTSWVNGTESNRVGTEQRDCGVVMGRGTRKPPGVMEMFYILIWMVCSQEYIYGKILHSTHKNVWPSLYINFTSTTKENNSNGRTEGKGLSLIPTNLEAGDLVPALRKSLKRGKKANELSSPNEPWN